MEMSIRYTNLDSHNKGMPDERYGRHGETRAASLMRMYSNHEVLNPSGCEGHKDFWFVGKPPGSRKRPSACGCSGGTTVERKWTLAVLDSRRFGSTVLMEICESKVDDGDDERFQREEDSAHYVCHLENKIGMDKAIESRLADKAFYMGLSISL